MDSTVAYARQELVLSTCQHIPIDLDEPRVLAASGDDITYQCIDRYFYVPREVVGGYVDAAAPRTRDTCREAIRSSGFNGTTRTASPGLAFCIETPDVAGVPGKLVRVEILEAGYPLPIRMEVMAWYR